MLYMQVYVHVVCSVCGGGGGGSGGGREKQRGPPNTH